MHFHCQESRIQISEITISLPGGLVDENEASAVLKPEIILERIRVEIRRRQIDSFFSAADKLLEIGLEMTEEEVMEEVRAARHERKLRY